MYREEQVQLIFTCGFKPWREQQRSIEQERQSGLFYICQALICHRARWYQRVHVYTQAQMSVASVSMQDSIGETLPCSLSSACSPRTLLMPTSHAMLLCPGPPGVPFSDICPGPAPQHHSESSSSLGTSHTAASSRSLARHTSLCAGHLHKTSFGSGSRHQSLSEYFPDHSI